MTVPYPHIPPVIVSIGPLALRWYGVMYVVGYFVGYRFALGRIRRGAAALTEKELDALIGYLVVGMLIGARVIYVLYFCLRSCWRWPFRVQAILRQRSILRRPLPVRGLLRFRHLWQNLGAIT
ncbi:MAG: hypothetical protein NVS1B5_02460 [Gemmatimonadaceae bacterium]